MPADVKSNSQQILQNVLDVDKQALRTTFATPVDVEFTGGEIEIESSAADGDSMLIVGTEDGTLTGVQHVVRTDNTGAIYVLGSFSGTSDVKINPSTNFEVKTFSVTTSAVAVTFAISPTAILVKALNNSGYIKIGKSDVVTNFYLLSPLETITFPIDNSSGLYVVRDAGVGTYDITLVAVN